MEKFRHFKPVKHELLEQMILIKIVDVEKVTSTDYAVVLITNKNNA